MILMTDFDFGVIGQRGMKWNSEPIIEVFWPLITWWVLFMDPYQQLLQLIRFIFMMIRCYDLYIIKL